MARVPIKVWVVLAIDVPDERIIILSCSQTSSADALAKAKERDRERPLFVYDMGRPVDAERPRLVGWLRSYGVLEDEARKIIRELAAQLLKMFRPAPAGGLPP